MKGGKLNSVFDTVVVGLGGSGSSALYHLSKTGRKVLGIDSYKLPHPNGSSHGDSRIIRQAYFEGEYYVPFVKRAYELWDDLEKKSGRKLLLKTGCLNMSSKEDNLVSRCKNVCDLHSIKYEIMSNDAVNKKYPYFNIPGGFECLEEREGGVLFPELCVQTHLEQATENKAEIRFDFHVEKIQFENGIYKISTKNEEILTHSLILSAGSNINNLLSNFGIRLPVTVDLNYVNYFKFKNTNNNKNISNDYSLFPVFLISYDADNEFYGFPDLNNGNGFKLSLYKQHIHFEDLSQLNRTHKKEEIFNQLTNLAKRFIRNFNLENVEIVKQMNCLYTSTPDKDFVIDALPGHDRVIVVSACSGHGFKFTTRIGEHAVNILEGKEKSIDKFRINRLL